MLRRLRLINNSNLIVEVRGEKSTDFLLFEYMDTEEGYYDNSVGGYVYTSEAIMDKLSKLKDSRSALVAEEWSLQEQIDQLQRQLETEQDPMAEMSLASQIGELNEAIDEREAEVEKIDKKIKDYENLALSASLKETSE